MNTQTGKTATEKSNSKPFSPINDLDGSEGSNDGCAFVTLEEQKHMAEVEETKPKAQIPNITGIHLGFLGFAKEFNKRGKSKQIQLSISPNPHGEPKLPVVFRMTVPFPFGFQAKGRVKYFSMDINYEAFTGLNYVRNCV